MEKDLTLEIAKLIGEPINPSLPVPVEIGEIADVDTADPGEKVWYFADLDDDVDEILDVNATTGAITPVKRSPLNDTQLTFDAFHSQLEYVLVDTVLGSPDTDVLARKKEAISRGLDKLELRLILKAITDSGDIAEISIVSGEDLYDVIMKAKHAVEDYGDDYVLLCGPDVKEAIDLYDKKKADNFNYNVTLPATLQRLGINVVKVFGKVKYVGSDSVAEPLMDEDKFILLARNSRIAKGKPMAFIRRKISADIAKLMGADVDKAQRAVVVNPTPVIVGGTNTLAYGIYAYESIIWAIKNPKAVVKSADLSAIIGSNL
jgi:hypothetical protein